MNLKTMLSRLLQIVLGIILSLLIFLVGYFVMFAFLFGGEFITTSSFALFFLALLIPHIFLGVAASLPIIFFIRRFRETILLKRALVILCILPFFPVLDVLIKFGLLIGPLPIPPPSINYAYSLSLKNRLSATATFKFSWDKNLALSQRIENTREAVKLFQGFATQKGWQFSESGTSCLDAIEKEYVEYKYDIEQNMEYQGVFFTHCILEGNILEVFARTGVYVDFDEDGGRVNLDF